MTNNLKRQVSYTLYLCDKKSVNGEMQPFEECNDYYLAQAQAALEAVADWLQKAANEALIIDGQAAYIKTLYVLSNKLREAAGSE